MSLYNTNPILSSPVIYKTNQQNHSKDSKETQTFLQEPFHGRILEKLPYVLSAYNRTALTRVRLKDAWGKVACKRHFLI